jgi:hypothetical protein
MSFFGLIKPQGDCEKIVIRHANGTATYLGKPNTPMFAIRRKIYLFKRRKELS